MPDKKSLVIIPTYNEIENVRKLIPDVLNRYENLDFIIVDDNSPDGTGEYVANLSLSNNRVKLIRREKKLGLGTAYIAGFKYAIKNKYDYIFEMNDDYSHEPGEIENFINAMDVYDILRGCRYVH